MKVEGRKAYAERNPKMVETAKRLYRKSPKTGERRSFREIAALLAAEGYTTTKGTVFPAASIKRMVQGQIGSLPDKRREKAPSGGDDRKELGR